MSTPRYHPAKENIYRLGGKTMDIQRNKGTAWCRLPQYVHLERAKGHTYCLVYSPNRYVPKDLDIPVSSSARSTPFTGHGLLQPPDTPRQTVKKTRVCLAQHPISSNYAISFHFIFFSFSRFHSHQPLSLPTPYQHGSPPKPITKTSQHRDRLQDHPAQQTQKKKRVI
jgi:hypothetical protein